MRLLRVIKHIQVGILESSAGLNVRLFLYYHCVIGDSLGKVR